MSDPGGSPIAVVTGGSRGAGRGIAVALGSHGCTVYVTGRSEQAGDHILPGDLTAAGNCWERPLGIAAMLDVGLRSSYVASYYAAPLMIARRHGLIAFTSASGAVHYSFGPAYGAHKAGMDKFAADMAVD